MTKSIVLTGGGTAGHVTPNIALMTFLENEGWQIHYIGSADGVEKNMMEAYQIPYYPIKCGKLRRYFSWKTFIEPFNIFAGMFQAYRILNRIKPSVVFSKGGFVAFPVVVGAWLNRIPVIVHESDMSPGLANRLSFPFADKICVTFAKTQSYIKRPVEVTGTPIRQQLHNGSAEQGRQLCQFDEQKPCLLVIGGSLGATSINLCVREAINDLCASFNVIHICGKGKIDETLLNKKGYCQFEYVNAELANLFALSDVVVSRAGANSVYEILALTKAHVFIPLSARVSRGDQVQNAQFFRDQGISIVLPEESLGKDTLLSAIDEAYMHKVEIVEKIQALKLKSGTNEIMQLIRACHQ